MSNHTGLFKALADVIADYRNGEIQPRTPDLVEAWIQQFPAQTHDQLLEALVHVFGKTYISRTDFEKFLRSLAITDKLAPGIKPVDFWRRANYLNIQQGGSSQRDILEMFDEVLYKAHGFRLKDTGSKDGEFIYLDDCIGTGNRVRHDICSWLETKSPQKVKLHVITPVLYAGSWWIDERIQETAKANGKTISMHKWRLDEFQMENRRAYRNSADVLWPADVPKEPATEAYAKHLLNKGRPVTLRAPGNAGASGIFQNDAQKILLEKLFLVRGCELRLEYGNLPESARPLGYHNLDSFGFGSMFVTYRNCPNNCPLVLWVQQVGYPALLPRKTNTQTAEENLIEEIKK